MYLYHTISHTFDAYTDYENSCGYFHNITGAFDAGISASKYDPEKWGTFAGFSIVRVDVDSCIDDVVLKANERCEVFAINPDYSDCDFMKNNKHDFVFELGGNYGLC